MDSVLARETVLRISEVILRAICAHDAATLSEHLAADFVLLGSGSRQTRHDFLEAVRTTDFVATEQRFEVIDVEVLGDTAIVAGVQRVEVESDGQRVVSRAAFTDVFVLQGERWLLRAASSHELT